MMKILNILVIVFICSCAPGGGTTTGNPVQISMEFASFNNSFVQNLSELFISNAYASISSLRMCFKRVRFKPDDGSIADNIDLSLGEVLLKEEGTPLTDITIPDVVYRRIEFDLSKDCDNTSKNSVTLENENGAFTSQDTITIKFEGEFRPSDGNLVMFVQNIIDSVKDYESTRGELKNVLEQVSGTF